MATLRERLAESDTDAALRLVADARPKLFEKVAELRNRHLKNVCELSDLTRDSYASDSARVARAGGDPRSISGTYASFRKLRAACIWKVKEDLKESLARIDRVRKKQASGELEALCLYDEQLPAIENRLRFLSDVKFDQTKIDRREKTHRQRHKLGNLPYDWLARTHQKTKDGIYGEAVALGILIPVRPAEIANRVLVKTDQSGGLVFEVKGSKIRGKGSGVASSVEGIGQATRWITITKVDPARQEVFAWLKNHVAANGGKLEIGKGLSARGLSSAFRSMSADLFPKQKSPPSFYALRHAACAELKASGLSQIEVAQGMGHASVLSQKAYGMRSQGAGGYVVKTSACTLIRQKNHHRPTDRSADKSMNGRSKKSFSTRLS